MTKLRSSKGPDEGHSEVKLTKAQSKKQKKLAASALQNLTNSPNRLVSDKVWNCFVCHRDYDESVKESWVECDQCLAKFHRDCTNFGKELFEYLDANPNDNIKWFCDNCQDKEKEEFDLRSALAMQNIKIDTLTQVVGQVKQQNDLITEQNKLLKEQNNFLVEQGNKMMDLVKGRSEFNNQIKIHVEEVLTDQKEKEEKKNNMILFGLEEGSHKEEDKNTDEDVGKVKEVFNTVNPEASLIDLDKSKIKRIGSRRVAEVGKPTPPPRPVKIVFDTQEKKMDILRNAKKLKDSEKFKGIGLSHDKTKKEQEDYRKLKLKLVEKNKESGSGNDYQIFRGNIVLKTEVQNILRKGKEDKRHRLGFRNSRRGKPRRSTKRQQCRRWGPGVLNKSGFIRQ